MASQIIEDWLDKREAAKKVASMEREIEPLNDPQKAAVRSAYGVQAPGAEAKQEEYAKKAAMVNAATVKDVPMDAMFKGTTPSSSGRVDPILTSGGKVVAEEDWSKRKAAPDSPEVVAQRKQLTGDLLDEDLSLSEILNAHYGWTK